MRTIRFLLEKEFRQIFRNKTLLTIILFVPVVQLLILPLAANYEVRNINIAVVDHDHSTYSWKLTNKITASGYFRLTSAGNSFAAALDEIETDAADLVLEIPPSRILPSDCSVNLVRLILIPTSVITVPAKPNEVSSAPFEL